MVEQRLEELCATLARRGVKASVHGDGQRVIRGIATLEDAKEEDLSFLSNPRYEKMLQTTRAAAVVLKPGIEAPDHLALIRSEDPYAAIAHLIVSCYGYRQHPRWSRAGGNVAPSARIGENANIHPSAVIEQDAEIGRDATIYPGVYVGPRTRIGDGVVLYPNVVIYEECVLGDRVTIHAGTVVGEDGLGYAPVSGKWVKIPQIGTVAIEDDVEIGSNCSIDRATLGMTRIGRGTKFSNLIAIGHGTTVGDDCLVVAQVGIAGSVQVGNNVTLAGQCGIVGHIKIGDRATVGARAGVVNSIPAGETVLGEPAIPIREMRRQVAHIARLPDLNESVKALDKRIAEEVETIRVLAERIAALEAREQHHGVA